MKAQKLTLRQRFWQWVQGFSRWFKPGLGIKRWMLVILAGITIVGLGLGMYLLDLYRADTSNSASPHLCFLGKSAFSCRALCAY